MKTHQIYMADFRVLLLISILFSVPVLVANADAGIDEFSGESQRLKSKISQLESSISDQAKELKSKDESISHLEKIIEEKSASVTSLERELESSQEKGRRDAEDQKQKANAGSGELEKQINKLKAEIQAQNNKKSALEERASGAEKKIEEMNFKLESLQKIIDEQRRRIQKTEHALQAAQEELMRAQLDAASKSEELEEIHRAWLPPWAATHMQYWQVSSHSCWKQHVKPTVDALVEKASERTTHAQRLLQPYLETAKSKWIPAAKDQLVTFTSLAKPYIQKTGTKVVEMCEASKTVLKPHFVKVWESTKPYIQEAKDTCKPYMDHLDAITRPHIQKAQRLSKPYRKRALRVYRRLQKSIIKYHMEVRATVKEKLRRYEATKPLATEEFVWLAASALLAVPTFFAWKMFLGILLAVFGRKKGRKSRSAHADHSNRRHKRRHAEKREGL